MKKKLDEAHWQKLEEVFTQVFSGMPCSNRATAAEKAAFDQAMEKKFARCRTRNLRVLEKLKRDSAAAIKKR